MELGKQLPGLATLTGSYEPWLLGTKMALGISIPKAIITYQQAALFFPEL